MDFFKKFKQPENSGYIFLSHSHSDIKKVRDIRNRLEENGFEPLCFYLKCLNDDSEIEDLIKREIDAREWFVFIDSENSRNSKWVALEREYIMKTNQKKILTVDINNSKDVTDIINKISHNLRIFLSYSHRDKEIALKIKNAFKSKDYLVFDDSDDLSAGSIFTEVISNAITEASRDGCVIALLTESFMQSKCTQFEIEMALNEGGNIIPIIIGDTQPTTMWQHYISDFKTYKLSFSPTEAEINNVIDQISQSILKSK